MASNAHIRVITHEPGWIAECQRCGTRVRMPHMPMLVIAFVRYLQDAIAAHEDCDARYPAATR